MTRKREEIVWDQASRGKTLKKIAAEVERQGYGRMSISAVSQMLTRIEDRAFTDQNGRVKGTKARQTSSLMLIFGEAFETFERSKQPARIRKVKTTVVHAGSGDERIDLPADEITRTKKWRDGNTQHLGKAMEALDRVRKIWGLDAVPDEFMGKLNDLTDAMAAEKALEAADAGNP